MRYIVILCSISIAIAACSDSATVTSDAGPDAPAPSDMAASGDSSTGDTVSTGDGPAADTSGSDSSADTTAWAPDRVVDPVNGDDNNSGAPGAPWKTLTKAGSSAMPGDIVAIRAGLYSEGLQVLVSGLAGDRTVFMAHPDNAAPALLQGKCVRIVGQSHVEIRGLHIEDCDGVGNHDDRGIYVQGIIGGAKVTDIVIAENAISQIYSSAISVWGVPWNSDPGDFKRIDGIVIEHNTIEHACEGGYNEQITLANGVINFEIHHNTLRNGVDGSNGGEGIDIKEGCAFGTIHHNLVHDIQRRAFYIDGGGRDAFDSTTHDIEVYANVAYNVVNGFALMSEGGEDVYNIKIYNNLFYDIDDDGAFIFDHPDAAANPGSFTNIEFTNNTFWNCGRNGLDLNSSQMSNVSVINNIFTSYLDRNHPVTASDNVVGGDPKFIDVGAKNFRLAAGSPALDQGTSNGAPNVDIDGNPRPAGNGYDIGAYEQ